MNPGKGLLWVCWYANTKDGKHDSYSWESPFLPLSAWVWYSQNFVRLFVWRCAPAYIQILMRCQILCENLDCFHFLAYLCQMSVCCFCFVFLLRVRIQISVLRSLKSLCSTGVQTISTHAVVSLNTTPMEQCSLWLSWKWQMRQLEGKTCEKYYGVFGVVWQLERHLILCLFTVCFHRLISWESSSPYVGMSSSASRSTYR